MKIGRSIMVFEKHGDALIADIDISNIDVNLLKQLFQIKANDPEAYDLYQIINEDQFNALAKYNSDLLKYSLNDYFLNIEAFTL